jgi:hypothetical protein
MKSTNLHRIDSSLLEHEKAVAIKGRVEQIEFAPGHENTERRPVSPLRFAINTFALYRRFGLSRRASLRHAARAFRSAR